MTGYIFLLLHDLPCFHVEAFFFRLPHRKSLARQGTIQDDRLEQVRFIHAWDVEPGVIR